MGQAHQIPVAPRAVCEKTYAKVTRKIKSVNVAIMKYFIIPAPLSIPSATSLADTTK